MKLYELFHENSKDYVADKELTKNSIEEAEKFSTNSCRAIEGDEISLAEEDVDELSSLMRSRESCRDFKQYNISLEEITGLLRNSYGLKSDGSGFKSVPSAGGLYPLEIYIAVFNSDDIDEGIYHYNMYKESLETVKKGKFAKRMKKYSHDQDFIEDASMMILVSSVFKRNTRKYGERGYRYAMIESGHVGQNVYLTALNLNLGVCASGGFSDDKIAEFFELGNEEQPIYSLYVGKPST